MWRLRLKFRRERCVRAAAYACDDMPNISDSTRRAGRKALTLVQSTTWPVAVCSLPHRQLLFALQDSTLGFLPPVSCAIPDQNQPDAATDASSGDFAAHLSTALSPEMVDNVLPFRPAARRSP